MRPRTAPVTLADIFAHAERRAQLAARAAYAATLARHHIDAAACVLVVSYDPAGGDVFRLTNAAGVPVTDATPAGVETHYRNAGAHQLRVLRAGVHHYLRDDDLPDACSVYVVCADGSTHWLRDLASVRAYAGAPKYVLVH